MTENQTTAKTETNYQPIDVSAICLPRWKKLQIKVNGKWATIEARQNSSWIGLRPGTYRVVYMNGKSPLASSLFAVVTGNEIVG